MRRVALFSLTLLLASCSSLTETAVKSVAGAALGTDAGLSADVQAGKNNARTLVGESSNIEVSVAPVVRDSAFETLQQDNRTSADERTVSADRVETVYVTQNQVPAWLLVAMAALVVLFGAVGWLSPQPKWLKKILEDE
jgi:hypothetical protein